MKNREREIVDFVVSEIFAPDGPLTLMHDINLKPYYKNKIRRWVKSRAYEELGVDFPQEERDLISEREFQQELTKILEDNE